MNRAAWLQCADVIVGQCDSAADAPKLVTAILDRYPGCVVAVMRHSGGRWCVLRTRSRVSVTFETPSGEITASVAEGLGLLGYACWIIDERS